MQRSFEKAVCLVNAQLSEGADCLLINKFGKHEASGRGFRDTIGEAIAMEIPVVVGLNPLNQGAFLEFVGDLAVPLVPEQATILDWIRTLAKSDAGSVASAA